ncbi:GMC family oxidoreductase N-terminal domain-containing protein [bacterium]|nr:GMC family oxidoreductase N-terminal domain-containing protein [bacterium]
MHHLIAATKGTLRRLIVAQLNFMFKKTENLLQKHSLNRINEVIRRNQMRPSNGTRWLISDEAALLEMLASLIVPSDEDTPGVNEMDVLGSSVTKTIETVIAGSTVRQNLYTEGLIAFDELAVSIYKSKFIELPVSKQMDLLKYLGISDKNPSKSSTSIGKLMKRLKVLPRMRDGSYPAIELFETLVQDVLSAFYTSEVSWIWLGYDGPPMPNGYPELLVPRTGKGTSGSGILRDLAASGYGIPAPYIPNKKEIIDVVVVGSGAGGGVVAKELAEAGLSVVVIEAGKRFNPFTDYPTDRTDFEVRAANVFDPDDKRRDLYTLTGPNWFIYNRAKGVGGSTLKYVGCSPRFHESDFRVFSEDGLAEDWPINYEDLEPFYSRVEYELGVSGPTDLEANPFDPPRSKPFPTAAHRFNMSSLVIKRGADKLGLHMVREPLALPSTDWNDRPACINAGTCIRGCSITAKSSIDVTYLRKAEKTRRVDIRSQCMAHRVTVGTDGKARGVVYFDKEGREHEVSARAVVLAGNAVETPRLLLLSKSSLFPAGLANSSGLVGKYFTEHLAVFALGLFSERMDPWRGTPTGGMIQDYYATKKANAFARGWTIYVSCNEQWPLSTAKQVPGWGVEHKRRTKQLFAHQVGLASVGEQLPDIRNQVTLDPVVKDLFGLPVPRLSIELGKNDRAMIKAIKESFVDILKAAGAIEILENELRPGGSCHYLGTCRMGSDPRRSVVNAWGRTHDVPNLFIADGSVFVTGAAVNPALTISALATRIAEGMTIAFQRGEL